MTVAMIAVGYVLVGALIVIVLAARGEFSRIKPDDEILTASVITIFWPIVFALLVGVWVMRSLIDFGEKLR